MPLTEEVEGRRRDAYETTKSDDEAAALLHMNPLTFKGWRESRGYPNKAPKPGNKTSAEELEIVRHMLEEGANFETIAGYINGHVKRRWLKTQGSVAWNAHRLGFITKEDLDQWYEDRQHSKRARRAEGRDAFRSAVLERDGGKCATCGSRTRLEVDHIIELWRGGPNDPSNGVTLCKACHSLKTRPRDDPGWHTFAEKYAAVLNPLGFEVEIGWCSEHRHHYLAIESYGAGREHVL